MSSSRSLKVLERFVVDNSPSILTGIAVVGTVTTALLTGKASFKAATIRNKEIADWEQELLPIKEEARILLPLVWKLYIPAATTGVLTIVCIIGANRIGSRRAAAIAAAYSIMDKAFEEYREKVVEKFGKNKEQAARDEIAQDRVARNPIGSREVVIVAGGDVECFDSFSGRYFKSNMESIKAAQNELNHKINNDYYASLSDLYNLLGLAQTKYSDEVGWNCDKLLEIEFSTVLSEDSKPCLCLTYRVDPVRGYYRIS